MLDSSQFWMLVVLLGAGTWAIRGSFLVLRGTGDRGGMFQRALRFIPAAVLPAIFVPGVVLGQGGAWDSVDLSRAAAALAAGGVGWKTGNVLATIGTGMAALWIMRAVFSG